jgi:hypothetical protein
VLFVPLQVEKNANGLSGLVEWIKEMKIMKRMKVRERRKERKCRKE